MASYRLEIAASAEKQLARLPHADRVRVARKIGELASVPRPVGCRPLRGQQDVYRIRVGVYRVIYSIEQRRIVVVVLKIGHRRDVYR
jgi:mRNA interferase RelE/StbE